MPAIQSITDDHLIAAIEQAKERVVLITPGIWPPVAVAVADAWKRLPSPSVSVILDVDPEVCRLGYGSSEALKSLQSAAKQCDEAIGHEPGVRICVLIADNQTFVFSPTPRLIEALPGDSESPHTSTPKSNGIVLSSPPKALEDDLGSGEAGAATRTVGLDPVEDVHIEEVSESLERNPPKTFDLARAVNVYNAAIQFVELKVSGYRLAQHKVALPKDLVKIAKENAALSTKIDTAIHLLGEEDKLLDGGEAVEKLREKLEEHYLRPITGIGKIILRSNLPDFEQDLQNLEDELEAFSSTVTEPLAERYRAIANDLATALLSDVMADLPPKWSRALGASPDPEQVKFKIFDSLIKAFGAPEKKVKGMKVTHLYKDVTYDMLKSEDFIAAVSKHFPKLQQVNQYIAARERDKPTKSDFHLD